MPNIETFACFFPDIQRGHGELFPTRKNFKIRKVHTTLFASKCVPCEPLAVEKFALEPFFTFF